jgi:hypothetical protein
MDVIANALGEPLVASYRRMVGGHEQQLTSTGGSAAELLEGSLPTIGVTSRDEDPRPPGCEPSRSVETDPSGAAGDEDSLTFHWPVPLSKAHTKAMRADP